MSLFEWFGESRNPGPVGRIHSKPDHEPDNQPPNQFWQWVGVLAGQGIFWFLLIQIYRSRSMSPAVFILFGIYLLGAYFLSPQPRTDNIGWLGGLIDHPFRISDDVNRLLLFFSILLLPGKLIIYSFFTIYRLLRTR